MSVVIDLESALRKHGTTLAEVANKTTLTEKQLELLGCDHYQAVRLSTIDALSQAIGCKPGELFSEKH
ncbi:MAG: helix-turn-helix transcriptional regulator [Raoultibacter sp.]